jgi:hypothetical protein
MIVPSSQKVCVVSAASSQQQAASSKASSHHAGLQSQAERFKGCLARRRRLSRMQQFTQRQGKARAKQVIQGSSRKGFTTSFSTRTLAWHVRADLDRGRVYLPLCSSTTRFLTSFDGGGQPLLFCLGARPYSAKKTQPGSQATKLAEGAASGEEYHQKQLA